MKTDYLLFYLDAPNNLRLRQTFTLQPDNKPNMEPKLHWNILCIKLSYMLECPSQSLHLNVIENI